MNDDLISRSALLKWLEKERNDGICEEFVVSAGGLYRAILAVENAPSVDAVETERMKHAIYKALIINSNETKYRYELGKGVVSAFLRDCIKYAVKNGEEQEE